MHSASMTGTSFSDRAFSASALLGRLSRFNAAAAFLAPLLTRLVLGYAFFLTRRGKWMNFDKTVGFFTQLGIPMPQANAAFVSSLEVFGGLLLIAGLGTRVISLLLGSTMVVALLTADKESFLGALGSDLTEVTPVVYLLFLCWLGLYGAGRLSLDTLVWRRFGPGNDRSD